MKILFPILVLLSLLSFPPQRQVSNSRDEEPSPIIDVHTHTTFTLTPERTSGIPQTQEQYFKEWEEAGVVGAVAHTSGTGEGFSNLKARNVIYCAGIGDEIK